MLGWPKSMLMNVAVKHLKKMVPKFRLPQAYSFHRALTLGAQAPLQSINVKSEDIAFLQYTGGTTGVSKGAVLTHSNIVHNVYQATAWFQPSLAGSKVKNDSVLTPLPLYHIFSLTINCLALCSLGIENILITNPKDIDAFIKLMKKPFTIMTGVNTLYNALLNHPQFSELKWSKPQTGNRWWSRLTKLCSQCLEKADGHIHHRRLWPDRGLAHSDL